MTAFTPSNLRHVLYVLRRRIESAYRFSMLAFFAGLALAAMCTLARGQVAQQLYGMSNIGTPYIGLYMLNPVTGVPQWAIPLDGGVFPSRPLTHLTSDGSRLWSIAAWQFPVPARIVRLRQSDGVIEEDWTTGYRWESTGIGVNPATGRIYAVCRPLWGYDTLYEIDPIGRTIIKIARLSGSYGGFSTFAISPSGDAYIFGAIGPDIHRIDLATGVTTPAGNLTFPGFTGYFSEAAFDASGILWVSYLDTWTNIHTGLYKVNLTTLTYTKVIQLAHSYEGLAWGALPPVNHYCVDKTSSNGCLPIITAQGYPCAVATSGFTIRATGIPNQKPGLMMYGTNGPQSVPFQGGTLCVGAPIQRLRAQSSGGSALPANDCSGSWSLDFNAEHFAMLPTDKDPSTPYPLPFPPGTTICAQWWGRDPGFPAPFNSILTNALQFTLAP